MNITKSFSQPVTIAQLNEQLASLSPELIELVQNGPEGLDLYFARFDGLAECLRLTAVRGPQGTPTLNVEFLPATNDSDDPEEPETADE